MPKKKEYRIPFHVIHRYTRIDCTRKPRKILQITETLYSTPRTVSNKSSKTTKVIIIINGCKMFLFPNPKLLIGSVAAE